ncbi:membrane protein [Bacteroidia bacterium]|nr:membrane protein [Bacteroidia bacterium]GHU69964.1 membrane protein [Bacteroidia bacterium]
MQFTQKIKLWWIQSQSFLRRLANLNEDTDVAATIDNIQKGIVFKGTNVWILFFAIIIASVGLNVNATAVIIGAMLISPLMGPINGIGLAIGIFDTALLRHSLKNLLVMMLISLTASTAYFFISPLSDAQSELLARTSPSIYDVLIAFFGGFAGIIALSRKEGKLVIASGVAIATALMPPLCTAGFGLATGQLNYFIGAFYLFFINSFFIALATFIMVRYLQFPEKQYIDGHTRRIMKRYITVFATVVIIPSVFMAWSMIAESRFQSKAMRYVQEIQKEEMFDETEIIKVQRNYTSKKQEILFSLVGKPLEHRQIERLQNRLPDFGLDKTNLIIKQMSGTVDVDFQANVLSNLLDKKEKTIAEKEAEIEQLTTELTKIRNSQVDNLQLARELAVEYSGIKRFSIATHTVYTDITAATSDTIPTLFIELRNRGNVDTDKLAEWLKVRLNIKRLTVVVME